MPGPIAGLCWLLYTVRIVCEKLDYAGPMDDRHDSDTTRSMSVWSSGSGIHSSPEQSESGVSGLSRRVGSSKVITGTKRTVESEKSMRVIFHRSL